MKALVMVLAMFPAVVAFPVGVVAQDASSGEALEGMNRSLARIVALLEAQAENQHTSLLLERLRIESDGLARVEASARGVATERDQLLPQLKTFKQRVELEEDRILRERTEPGQEEARARRQALELGYLEVARLEEAVAVKEQALAELEDEMYARRAAYESLKQEVDERLGLNR